MVENQIKEAISEAFVRLILAHDGFNIFTTRQDQGVDFLVGPVKEKKLASGDSMYQDSDRRLDIQLKATTEKQVEFKKNTVEYNLRYKNYVTLKGQADSPYIKMILVLFILPEDKTKWIRVVKNSALLRKRCFWYIPSDSIISPKHLLLRKNSTVKVEIPLKNHLLNNFTEVYNKVNGI